SRPHFVAGERLPPVAAGPELPRQPGARSQGQACEIRNGAPLPGSDSGEGARSKRREAAAGNGEGAYTDVRDRAGDGENEAPRRLSPRPTHSTAGVPKPPAAWGGSGRRRGRSPRQRQAVPGPDSRYHKFQL